ncbi:MAG: hypothetical protein ABIJ05_04980 [Patescibacteria group bacterium]
MGYITELNTLIGLPQDFDIEQLSVGSNSTIIRDRERTFPLHIAMLMVTSNWDILGYAVVNSMKNFDKKCELEFEVISLFNDEEKKLYKDKFIEAAKVTGEVK